LLVAGRGRGARTFALQLDEAGEASQTVLPSRDEWPALDLVVASAEGRSHRARVPMLLQAAVAPKIALPSQSKPGSTFDCRIETGIADTVVTVAVVDERIFAIDQD